MHQQLYELNSLVEPRPPPPPNKKNKNLNKETNKSIWKKKKLNFLLRNSHLRPYKGSKKIHPPYHLNQNGEIKKKHIQP